ncbi:MAG: hypothetical protein ACYTGK_19950, partial [Planctomycetota bacterium]
MPRVNLPADALGYMTKIGVSAEKGARLIRRAPRAERPRAVVVPIEERPAPPRSNARILRTFFKMLAILVCIFVLFAILDSVRAAEGNLGTVPPIVLEPASGAVGMESILTGVLAVGERLPAWSGAHENPTAERSGLAVLVLGVGMALIAFLLISMVIAISAFTVGLIDGAWLLHRLHRRRPEGQIHEDDDALDLFPRGGDAVDGKGSGSRPGHAVRPCPRWWGLGLA